MAGIVNAVRVSSDKARSWYVNSASISTYGRWEGVLQAADATEEGTRRRIGLAHLKTRATPAQSVVAQVVADGLTFDIGDYIEVDGEVLRCIGITRRLQEDGTFELIPEFSTLDELARKNAGRTVDQLVRQAGSGSPVAAPVRDNSTRSTVTKGRIGEMESQRWSWTDLADLEPGDWQVWNVDRPVRIVSFRCDADWFEVVDGVAEPVALGTTSFTFTVNNSTYTPQPTLEMGITGSEDELPIWGSALLSRGDKVRVRLLNDGGHINGSVTIRYTTQP